MRSPNVGASFPQQILVLLGLLLVTFICSYAAFGRSQYYGVRSSTAVLRKMHAHDRSVVEGISYLNSLDERDVAQWLKPKKPKMCVSIVTRNRAVPYVQALIASLLRGNDAVDVSSIDICLLNTENTPTDHLDLRIIQSKLPFISIRHSSTWDRGGESRWKSRESMDYAAALDTCASSGAPWVIVLEEDAVLANNFIRKTLKLLHPYVERPDTAYVKLWFSDRWDGFENDDIFSLIGTSTLISAILTLGLRYMGMFSRRSKLLRPYIRTGRRPHGEFEAFTVFVLFTVIIAANAALIGRQNLLMFRDQLLLRGQRVEPLGEHHGAGTVAVAYPLRGAVRAAEYIRIVGVGEKVPNIDVLLSDDYLRRFKNITAFEVTPPLAQHIGAYSSDKRKNNGRFDILGQNDAFRDRF